MNLNSLSPLENLPYFTIEAVKQFIGDELMINATLYRWSKAGEIIRLKKCDFYDLLWFMQQKVTPLEEKLAKDGQKPYITQSAFAELSKKVETIKLSHLAEDLLPLFKQRSFIEAWLEGFKENFYH